MPVVAMVVEPVFIYILGGYCILEDAPTFFSTYCASPTRFTSCVQYKLRGSTVESTAMTLAIWPSNSGAAVCPPLNPMIQLVAPGASWKQLFLLLAVQLYTTW